MSAFDPKRTSFSSPRKIFYDLRPTQRQRADKGFAIMAWLFDAATPA
jgi:hypothetical protein